MPVVQPNVFFPYNNLLPLILGVSGANVVMIDANPFFFPYTTPSGSVPPTPASTGDGLQYFALVSNGSSNGNATETPAQAAIWCGSFLNAGNDTNWGYPGPGNTADIPYGAPLPVFLRPSGYVIVSDWINTKINGTQTSPATSGSNAELWVLNPTTCKAVYDVLPALSSTPAYIWGVLPCADSAHALVLTGSTSSGADRWHLLSLSATAATEVATGPWTSGPEKMIDSDNSTFGATIPLGQSTLQSPAPWNNFSSSIVGMLESDLSHLWLVCSSSEFYVLSLSSGNNYSVVFHGLGGRHGTTPFVAWVDTSSGEGGSTWMSMFADKGVGIGMTTRQNPSTANVLSYWTYVGAGPQEIDVAKEAISGDTSWRTIFCGFDVPRFTDLGLASGLTSGGNPVTGSSTVASNAGPYPIYYRKLGVSNPTLPPASALVPLPPGSNALTVTETFDNPTQWNLINNQGGNSHFDNVGGNPGANLFVISSSGTSVYPEANKNFSFDPTLPVTEDVDFAWQRYSAGNGGSFEQKNSVAFDLAMDTSGGGSEFRITIGPTGATLAFYNTLSFAAQTLQSSTFVPLASIPTWHTDADPNWTGPFISGHWYHAKFTVIPNAVPSTATITYLITDPTGPTTIFSGTVNNLPIAGSNYGLATIPAPPGQTVSWQCGIRFDNLVLKGTGPGTNTQNLQTTTYLYTLVNDLAEESGPSPAMLNTDGTNFITRPIGQGVQITLPGTLALSGADATYFQVNPGTFIPPVQLNGTTPSPTMNLYRAVTGSSGTQFLLVAANIPFSGGASTLYTDTLPDSALSEVIPSLFTVNGVQGFWAPPPTTMLGILALANGIYAGFTGNILCLSAQAIPHAWPQIYQLVFDYDIVGMEAVDVSIVVCTKKFPYFCSGNTPDQYSQTKATYPYACASKRSIKYLKGVGVVYATFEGLVAIAGPGQERVLTEGLFSKREWLALNPSSFIAEINDGRYFCAYTTGGGTQGAFYIDVMDQGSGKVSLGWHFTARYNDPLSDVLYVVPDFVDPAIPIGVPLQNIAGFEQTPGSPLPYVWKSKQFYVPQPTTWRQARIQAESYASLVLTLFADGVQYAQITVTSNQEFALPPPSINGTSPGVINKYFEFQIASPDFVDRVQFVESPEEWALLS